MVAFRSAVASALLAVTPVLAATFSSPTHLYARQISGFDPSAIPTSCLQSQCQGLINIFSQDTGCTTLDCICTASIYSALQKCLTCEASLDAPGVNQTLVQQTLSGYQQACDEGGHPVSASSGGSTGTTSGSGSSGTSSTAASAGAATSASSPTTTGGSSGNQKNSAVIGLGISVVGSVAAFVLSGVNIF